VTKLASLTTESSALSSEPEVLLEELLDRYPIPGEWSRPLLFTETLSVGTLSLNLCGLSVEGEEDVVTGSAADLSATPLSRAYFELIERAALVTANRDPNREFTLRDVCSRAIGIAQPCRVFPQSADPAQRFARSNGVAVGASWRSACRAARWELIERDRILRSWYGETRPRRLTLPAWSWLTAFEKDHDWRAYRFPECSGMGHGAVVGVFAFPRSSEHALCNGFAAAQSSARAIERAAAECLQHFGFLWGEALPTAEPPFAPTAEYHQEFYLQSCMHTRVRDWLAGDHAQTPCRINQRAETRVVDEFADLTPDILRGKLFVAKALPGCELELVFGRGHPRVAEPLPGAFQVHPIP
jgi:hypothetical protein